MNRKSLIVGLTCSLIALGLGKADAGEIPVKFSFSGAFVNTQTDANEDGQKGGFISLGTKGTLGSGTLQGVSEFVFSGPATCPNGHAGVELTLLQPPEPERSKFVHRFDSTGDLLFIVQTSATICFDPLTEIQFFNATSENIGGTGRFVDATGTSECSGTAKTLFEDAAGNFFGEQSGTCTGTLITP